jgi:hypothetical protein
MAARFIALCVLIFMVMSVGFAPLQAQTLVTCPEVVQRAIDAVGSNCGALGRNSACYGFQSVTADFSQIQPSDYFSLPSDRANLFDIERLGTSPLNEALDEWGIALMSVQANLPNTLPGQSVVFMLLGDSKVENAVDPGDALQSDVTLDITLASDTPLHQDPDDTSALLQTVPGGTSLVADALSEDGGWLRVVYQGIPGWVSGEAADADGDLSTLQVIGPDSGTPMQSFYFQSGISSTQCVDAPNALVVQGPQNLTVDINANGADIRLGSTIVLYQVAVDAATQQFLNEQYGNIGNVPQLLQIVVLDGHVILNVGTPQQIELNTGETTFRCLSDTQNLGVNGLSDDRQVIDGCPWAEPRPVTVSQIEPFRYLDNVSLNYPINLPLQLPVITTTVLQVPSPTNTPLPTATPTPDVIATVGAAAGGSVPLPGGFVPDLPPVAAADSATTDEDTTVVVPVLDNDKDLDIDTLTITGVSDPAGGSATSHPDGTVSYTPDVDFYGSDSFTYTITDGDGLTDTATVTVTVAAFNDPPAASDDCGVDGASTYPGVSVKIYILDNDTDSDFDSFSIDDFTDGAFGTVSIDTDEGGLYALYSPPTSAPPGSDSFTYTVSDDSGATDTATVCITILGNTPPIAMDDSATTYAGVPVAISVLDNDSDPEGFAFSISSFTSPSDGTVTHDGITTTYTPDPGFTGVDTFTYTITDASGDTATATVTVTVIGNSPPSAIDDSATTSRDTAVFIDVLSNDSDPEGNALTVSSVVSPGTMGGTISNDTFGVTYFPPTGFVGIDTFTYTNTDGDSDSAPATVTVTVTGNSLPIAVDDTIAVDEDSPTTSIPVLDNDSDPDSFDTLSISGWCGSSLGDVTTFDFINIEFTPYADLNGSEDICYFITDGSGASVGATIHLTVNPINDPPTAGDDSYVTMQDDPITETIPDILDNDADIDGDDLSPELVDDVSSGSLTLFGDGSFEYTPAPGFFGTDFFTYQAEDPSGALSGLATVTITVVENGVPMSLPDTYTTLLDTPLTVPAPGVLSNDTDLEGDPLTATLVSGAASGATVMLSGDGSFTYTPVSGFLGIDTFTYTASDTDGTSPETTVRIGVGVTAPILVPGGGEPLPPPYPTQTPLAPFIDYTYIDEMVRSSVPEPLRYTVFGRMIVRNRVLLPSLNYGYIGDKSLIDMGVIHAIDIFSTIGTTDFGVGVGICMKGQGRLFFLNANFTPRSPRELDWSYVDGYTCGTILAPGIVVLVEG